MRTAATKMKTAFFIRSFIASAAKRAVAPATAPAVHERYNQYMAWSFATNALASAESVLATHSMLSAVVTAAAVPAGGAAAISVTANYIGKDAIGQMASVWVINRTASDADKKPKALALRCNVVQQVATFAECVTPLLPALCFVPVAAAANVGKCVSFAGFGAINASVLRVLAARDENIGEIYNKAVVVNTISTAIGAAVGIAIAAAVPSHAIRAGFVIPCLGVLRVVSYNRSVEGLLEGGATTTPGPG